MLTRLFSVCARTFLPPQKHQSRYKELPLLIREHSDGVGLGPLTVWFPEKPLWKLRGVVGSRLETPVLVN